MDARDEIRLKNEVLSEVRKMVNAKFQTGNEELSPDSKVAVQQLGNAVSAIRDELSKTHSSFRLVSTVVDDINQRMGVLGAEIKDSRVVKDIADLKIAIDKLWDQIVATDSNNRLGVVEKAMADVVHRMAAIEKFASTPVKRNPAEVHSANVDHAAINDVTARMGDVLTQLQGVKLQIEDVSLRVIAKEQGVKTTGAVDQCVIDRLNAIEKSLASVTETTIDSLVRERELHRGELDALRSRLDASEKATADLNSRFKAFTTMALNQISVNSNGTRLDGVPQVTGVEPRLEALESKVNGPMPAHAIAPMPHQPVIQPPVNFDFQSIIPVQLTQMQIPIAQPAASTTYPPFFTGKI